MASISNSIIKGQSIYIQMGNSEPEKDPRLSIFIETQKTFYNSGSIIQGVVFVNALQNFNFDALYIRIEGDQFCKWFEGTSKNRKKYLGTQKFYADEHMLCKYHNHLQQGRYAYPFALELSQNIPGSFKDSSYNAKIQYKLVAYFTNFNDRKLKFIYGIPLVIRQPFRQDVYEYEGEVTVHPTTWCCFKQGTIRMHACFKKNVCFQGEDVPVQISIDNTDGKCDVIQIIISLVQYTFVSANNGISRTYRSVIDKNFIKQIVLKGQKKDNINISYRVKNVRKQTAISTLVANYYRLEVMADVAKISKNEPIIYAPLFLMKKSLESKVKNTKSIKKNFEDYKKAEPQFFKAPDFWFKMNKDLQVINFRLEDVDGYNQHAELMNQRQFSDEQRT